VKATSESSLSNFEPLGLDPGGLSKVEPIEPVVKMSRHDGDEGYILPTGAWLSLRQAKTLRVPQEARSTQGIGRGLHLSTSAESDLYHRSTSYG